MGRGNPRKKTVVVTHHAPIRKGSSKPQHENNPWSDGFATELLTPGTKKLAKPLLEVDCFVFGHTHFTTLCTRGSVKLISNQRGYVFPGQQQNAVDYLEGIGANQRNHRPMVLGRREAAISLPRSLATRKPPYDGRAEVSRI